MRTNRRPIAIMRRSCSDSPLARESIGWSFRKRRVKNGARDKGRIVEGIGRETKDLIVCARGYSQRELGWAPRWIWWNSSKGGYRGGDDSVRAKRRAAMDVGGIIGRSQATKRYIDLYCVCRRVQRDRCEARPIRRHWGRRLHLICSRKVAYEDHWVSVGSWCGQDYAG